MFCLKSRDPSTDAISPNILLKALYGKLVIEIAKFPSTKLSSTYNGSTTDTVTIDHTRIAKVVRGFSEAHSQVAFRIQLKVRGEGMGPRIMLNPPFLNKQTQGDIQESIHFVLPHKSRSEQALRDYFSKMGMTPKITGLECVAIGRTINDYFRRMKEASREHGNYELVHQLAAEEKPNRDFTPQNEKQKVHAGSAVKASNRSINTYIHKPLPARTPQTSTRMSTRSYSSKPNKRFAFSHSELNDILFTYPFLATGKENSLSKRTDEITVRKVRI